MDMETTSCLQEFHITGVPNRVTSDPLLDGEFSPPYDASAYSFISPSFPSSDISQKKMESRRWRHVRRRLMRPVRPGANAETLCVPNDIASSLLDKSLVLCFTFFPTSSWAPWQLLWRPEYLDFFSSVVLPYELFKIGDAWWLMCVFRFRNCFQLPQTLILTMSNLDPYLDPPTSTLSTEPSQSPDLLLPITLLAPANWLT